MHLYLVHHADAVGPDVDPLRPLSERGRVAVEALAQRAVAHGVKPDVIWHSGKLRARQTAEVFLRACHPFARFSAMRGLQPDDQPSSIADTLIDEKRDIMLVGHMPHLAGLLGLLIKDNPDTNRPGFPPHGIVELERNETGTGEPSWVEVWRDV
jgi:phosphohistidine phosphatase